jgi:hypothetical protein
MRNRHHYPILFCAAALFAACGAAPAADRDAAVRQLLAEREQSKTDLLFGSAAERRVALAWFADDYLNIAGGPAGHVERTTLRELAEAVESWPQFPPGTFVYGDVMVIRVDGYIVSSLVSGPDQNGRQVAAWNTSVWARRDDEWKTVLYQLTPR